MELFDLGSSRGVRRLALVTIFVLAPGVAIEAAADLAFAPLRFPPGDQLVDAAAGMQEQASIARGGDQYLIVWSDGRSSIDHHYPFATEGTGTDIYGVRLDAAGDPIDACPFVIDQTYADQSEPRVAWNGENWLVVYESPRASYYDAELRAVRVAPDGTILDAPALVLDTAGYWYEGNYEVEGGDGEWVVLFAESGPLRALRVAGDGAVVNPGGLLIHDTSFLMDFDIAFAQDEYLIIWEGAFDSPRGRRYSTDLQLLGTTVLPFAEKVATDGTDFLVVSSISSLPERVDAVRISHAGGSLGSFNVYTAGGQEGTCCVDVTWDGSVYWVSWAGLRLVRVDQLGRVLDPGSILVPPPGGHTFAFTRFAAAPAGGLQTAYNHSYVGADDPKDVYTARISPSAQLGDSKVVSSGAPAQLEADFAEGNGIHLVAFLSRGAEDGRILVQRIDDTGTAIDPEPIEVATGPIPGDDFGPPSLGAPGAAWNGSVFMIVWSDGLQILARRMLPDGTFLDATPLTVMDGHDPDVAAVGQVFLVVGLDFLLDNPHWQATHSMRVDGGTGQNLDAEPNALGGFAIFARHPHVVSWGDRWLAVWQRNLSHDDTIAGTTAAIVDADGTTPGLIDVPLGWRPDVAVSPDRALFVAVTHTIASAYADVEGVVMLADGSFPGPSFVISDAADKQLRPAVTWNGSEFVVAWEDKRNSVIYFDERTDIYGARVASDGTVLDPAGVSVAAAAAPELQPALVTIGGTALLGVSVFRADDGLGAYRIGIAPAGGPTAVDEITAPVGSTLRVLGARPNPTSSSTRIRFVSAERAPVRVRLFDASGRLVRTLANGTFAEGGTPVDVSWDGRDDTGRTVASGVYFYELRTPVSAASGRLVVRR